MRIGILGGGQLGKMLALSGYPLGLSFYFYDPDTTCCSKELAPIMHHEFTDHSALTAFAKKVDVITYENENIPVPSIQLLQSLRPVFPSIDSIKITQDRLLEKECLQQLNIPTTPFLAINAESDLQEAIKQLGFPFIVKTRHHGYDGKGQVVVRSNESLQAMTDDMLKCGCIAEKWVNYRREFSVISVSSKNQDICFYDLCENVHENGILRTTQNKRNDPALFKVIPYIHTLLQHFSYYGVMTVEFFETESGQYLVNEIAPRVHNSGHWTIEGAKTCQFQNHLRAGLQWPLGSTESLHNVVMKNIIGTLPNLNEALQIPNSYLHLYGKGERPGRKLGHQTIIEA